MAKIIRFDYQGKTYTLEFTRKSVEQMERQGFELGAVDSKPTMMLPALFAGAFLAHHKYEKKEKIDKIFSLFTNREELFNKLAEMYNDTVLTLVEEPEEDEGNLKWEANW